MKPWGAVPKNSCRQDVQGSQRPAVDPGEKEVIKAIKPLSFFYLVGLPDRSRSLTIFCLNPGGIVDYDSIRFHHF